MKTFIIQDKWKKSSREHLLKWKDWDTQYPNASLPELEKMILETKSFDLAHNGENFRDFRIIERTITEEIVKEII